MTFVYTGPISIRDNESDVEIASKGGFRDGEYTFDYIFKQGDLQFVFEVLYVDSAVPYTYHAKDGGEVPSFVDDSVCVMEQSLRRELYRALHKMGKPDPAESEYAHFKNIIKNGLSALFTKGGETLQYIPDGKFKVEFEDNVPSFAAKYPGKIRGYVPQNTGSLTN